jgi:hypothetical protein
MVFTDWPGSMDTSTEEALRGSGRQTHQAETEKINKAVKSNRLTMRQNQVITCLS